MRLNQQHIAIVVALFVCVVFSVATGSFAYYSNQGFGFPLDDPWIHLQLPETSLSTEASPITRMKCRPPARRRLCIPSWQPQDSL